MKKRPPATRGTGRSRNAPQNGPAIREFRLLKRWSVTALAAEVGIAQSTLSKIESEQRTTSHEVLDAIADALEVDRESVRREKDPNAEEKTGEHAESRAVA